MPPEIPQPKTLIQTPRGIQSAPTLRWALYAYDPVEDDIVSTDTRTNHEDDNKSEEEIWNLFLARLQEDECRYGIYDFVYESGADREWVEGWAGDLKRKLVWIVWGPWGAEMRDLMHITRHNRRFREALGEFDDEMRASYKWHFEYGRVIERLERDMPNSDDGVPAEAGVSS